MDAIETKEEAAPPSSKDTAEKDLKLQNDSDEDSDPEALPIVPFDDVLKMCGDNGCWQLQKCILLSYVGFLSGLHNIVYAFIGSIPDYYCRIEGLSKEEVVKYALPNITIDGKTQIDSCFHYSVNFTNSNASAGASSRFIVDKSKKIECKSYYYENSPFETTIPMEWNLVCEMSNIASSVQGFYLAGVLVGCVLFGTLTDKIGRKKTIIIGTLITAVSAPLVAASPHYIMAIITRFFLGLSAPGSYVTSFVLIMEIVGIKWREVAGTVFNVPYGLGYMTLAGFGYGIRKWRYLQLAICGPILIQILIIFFIPESPRWLLKKAKFDAAEKLLRKIAKTNKKELPEDFRQIIERVAHEENTTDKSVGEKIKIFLIEWAGLFKYPRIRLRTIIIYVCWISTSMTYYGVSSITPKSQDPFLYILIGGVLEFPAYILNPPLIKYVGRKLTFSGYYLICGLALLSSLAFPVGSVGVTALALTGKVSIASAYILIYIYAAELFPTLIRARALGTASMIGHIGSVISPYIGSISGGTSTTIPVIIFGSVSLISSISSLFLPETKNRKLPETIAEVENEGKKKKKRRLIKH